MRNPNYDPRSTLGHTYLRQAHWEERNRNEGIAQSTGERMIYAALILSAIIITLSTAISIAKKIVK